MSVGNRKIGKVITMSRIFFHETAVVDNVKAGEGTGIYRHAYVKNTELGDSCSIGDYSRIEDSRMSEHVIIQRNNMIYSGDIGRYTYTGRNTTIWHSQIGAFCSLSWNVSIGGANHDYTRVTTHSFIYSGDFGLLPPDEEIYDRFSTPCIIGNDVWIAANACICRGAIVGNGAVIAAGSVVTKDVEPYTIVGGVPARPIKKRFSEDIIQRLEKICWWELPADVIKDNFQCFNSVPDEACLSALESICERGK